MHAARGLNHSSFCCAWMFQLHLVIRTALPHCRVPFDCSYVYVCALDAALTPASPTIHMLQRIHDYMCDE